MRPALAPGHDAAELYGYLLARRTARQRTRNVSAETPCETVHKPSPLRRVPVNIARGWELGERTRVDMHTTLGRAGLETLDTLIMAGIADTRAEAIGWALARIRERPAFERLREHLRETGRLRKAF